MTEQNDAQVPRWLRQTAGISWRLLVIAAAIALIGMIVIRLRLLFLPAFVALLLATVLAPLANALIKRRVPRSVASFIVLVGFLGLFVGAIALLAPQVADELDDLGQTVKAGAEDVLAWLSEGPLDIEQEQVDNFVDQAGERLRENGSRIAGGAVAGTIVIAELIAGLFLTLVLLFFFIKDGHVIARWILGFVTPSHRDVVSRMGVRGWETLTGYVRGTAIIAFVDALIIGIGLFVIGVPLVIPLMVLTFIGGFFPLVGAVLAGIVAALIALVTNGVVDALLVVAIVTVVQQVEGDVLQPLVMGRAVNLHPLAVLLGVTAGGFLGGIAGAFVAVPVIAVIAAASSVVRKKTLPESPEGVEATT
jgi:predicted PurR-regulated permease PerM